MRIVSRKEFLAMPSGTLYQQCSEQWAFDEMRVKYESLLHGDDGDFICGSFTDIDANSSEQLFERIDGMCENGESYPLERIDGMCENGESYPLDLETTSRDGCFSRNA